MARKLLMEGLPENIPDLEENCPIFLFTKATKITRGHVGDCGKAGRKHGAMECSNIGERKGTYDAVVLEKVERSRAVRSYVDVTREYVQTPLGQNRLIIP